MFGFGVKLTVSLIINERKCNKQLNKNLKFKDCLMFPVNVRILQTKSDGSLVNDYTIHNMCLKEYALYSYVRFILGSFNNGAIFDYKQYVPKYLAVGSNKAPLNGAPGTSTAVQISDISLFHEIDDCDITGEPIENNRIKLSRANFIEDDASNPYLKIQFEAYIPEDRFVGQTIGELALMTQSTGWNAYARVTGFPDIIKAKNEIIQIIWEITIISVESSNRYSPVIKKYLLEAIEKAIDVLQKFPEDPVEYPGIREALNKLIQPATVAGTGLYYLLNDNESITQDVVNNYLSKPFNSITDSGLIPMIQKIDFSWAPNWNIVK